jgi:hypothetical protein
LQVLFIPISKIIPYEGNPRINDEAVSVLAKSIQNFGFKVPIVLDKNYCIICGHTRYKAAQRLMLENVPCTIAENLTSEQIKKYRIMDNKASDLATWNKYLLEQEIRAIGDESVREYFREGFRFYSQDEPVDKSEFVSELIFTQSEIERFRKCLSLLQVKYSETKTKGELLLAQIDEWNLQLNEGF